MKHSIIMQNNDVSSFLSIRKFHFIQKPAMIQEINGGAFIKEADMQNMNQFLAFKTFQKPEKVIISLFAF